MSAVKSFVLCLAALCLQPQPCSAQTTFWNELEGPPGGTVNAILVTPTGRVVIGTTRNVYHSVDGVAWQKIENSSGNVSALEFHPDGFVLVGTDGGLFRLDESSNRLDALGHTGGVRAIAVTPDGTILVGGINIYRSIDGGQSFNRLGLSTPFTRAFLIDSTGTIYAGLWNGGVLRSTDFGDTWRRVNNGLTASTRTVWDLEVDSRGNLYAATSGGLFQLGERDTWVPAGFEDIIIFSLAVDQEGDLLVGTARHGLYTSADQGTTWIQQTDGLPTGSIHAIAHDGEGRLLVGTNHHGLFRQSASRSVWTMWNEGISDTEITALTADADGNVFAAVGGLNTPPKRDYTGSLYKSTDKGRQWREITTGPTCETKINVLATGADGGLYAATTNEGVYRSEDGGASWQRFVGGLTTDSPLGNVISLAFNEAADVFAGTCCGVYQLKHTDTVWTLLSTEGLPYSDPLIRSPSPISTLAIDKEGTLYAGTADKGVHRFVEEADSWVASSPGPTWVRTVHFDQDGALLAATWYNGLFISTDGGSTWATHNTGLTDLHIRVMAVNAIGERFAATLSDGVFRSAGGAEPWLPVNEGLQELTVSTLSFDGDGFLYAGTHEEGVLRSAKSTLVSVSHPDRPAEATVLHPNYPNPFSAKTTISFSLDSHGPATLRIYNLLGEEVATVFSEVHARGTYSLEWDAAHLASGLYVGRLESADQVQMIKMIVRR